LQAKESPVNEKQLVQSYLEAFYREQKDYHLIEGLFSEDFQFIGPMATFNNGSAFMQFIKEIGSQKTGSR